MGISTGQVAFQLAYQVSPIVLTNGIAANFPGGALPIMALIDAGAFTLGLLSGASAGPNGYWANFQPLPGSTLVAQRFGKYPYANQAVAANAVIADPLVISMLMLVPASAAGGYLTKIAIMTALIAALKQHNGSGGTYTILTPSYCYTNCLLADVRDVTAAQSKQVQIAYQFDFEQPLLTLQDATAAQNSLMSKITGGLQLSGQDPSDWSAQTSVGQPLSLASSAVAPGSTNTPATIAATPLPPLSNVTLGPAGP